MLPPTIMMAPTSPIARPNPASDAVKSARRPSQIKARILCRFDAFSEISRSWYSAQSSRIAWCEIETTSGVAIITCAMIIAVGV